MKRHYGKIKISKEVLEDIADNDEMRFILSEFLVIDAKSNWAEDFIEYIMYHESFRLLDDYEIIPEYRLIITKRLGCFEEII